MTEQRFEIYVAERSATHEVTLDPVLRLRRPFTGDQEQMLADMRKVEALRGDVFEGLTHRLAGYAMRRACRQFVGSTLRAVRN